MAFSTVGATKVKKEIDVEAERAISTASPNCNGSHNPLMYNLGARDQRKDFYPQKSFPSQTPESTSQSQQVFVNEGSRGAGRATHDFLSLYGGMPSHFVESGPARGSSSLTTQDLLQPLERGSSPKYQDSQALPLDKHTKEDTLSQHASISTPIIVDRIRPVSMNNQVNMSSEVPQRQLLRMSGQEGNMQGVRCKPQMSLSTPLPSQDEHLVVDHMKNSDATTDQGQFENNRCWSNPRVNYPLSDLLYLPKGSSNHSPLDGHYQTIPVLSRNWQKANSLVEIAKRQIKVPSEDEDEGEGLEHSKDQRKENHFHRGEHTSRDKNLDTRASTPRSKHSATEQRRRSKINDRFQMLRNLVPHSDQKRDKASFLLEVIEYVQMLQEKVRKYEGVEQGRHQERLKNMMWETCKKNVSSEAFMRETTTVDNAAFLKNISSSLAVDVKQISETHDIVRSRLIFPPSVTENGAASADFGPTSLQQTCSYVNGRSALANYVFDSSLDNKRCKNGVAKPSFKSSSMQQEFCSMSQAPSMHPTCSSDAQTFAYQPKTPAITCDIDESAHCIEADVNNTEQSRTQTLAKHQGKCTGDCTSQPQKGCSPQINEAPSTPEKSIAHATQGPSGLTVDSQQINDSHHTNGSIDTIRGGEISTRKSKHMEDDCTKQIGDESPEVTGGIISVSSIYSQELLDTLTQALQSSGVDLSQANIFVQIELGKHGASAACSSEKAAGFISEPSRHTQQSKGHDRPAQPPSEHDARCKKPKLQDSQDG